MEFSHLLFKSIHGGQIASAPNANLGNGYFETAVKNSKKAVELSPNWGLAWTQLGGQYYNLKMFQESEVAYKRGMQISPHYPASYSWLWRMYTQQGRKEDALEMYKICLKEICGNPILVWQFQRDKQWEDARFWLEKCVEDFGSKENISQLAWHYLSLSEFEEAEKLYRKIISINSDEDQFSFGQSLLFNGKIEEALKIFESLGDTTLMGLANIDLGNYEVGLALLKKAMKFQFTDADSFLNIGIDYLKTKEFSKEAEYFGKAASIANSAINIGWGYLKMKKYVEAEEQFKQSLQILKNVKSFMTVALQITVGIIRVFLI